ncbi:MAG: hypothetical protein QXS27_08380, partial [Candidatus Jordarchaeaceae archaeon]
MTPERREIIQDIKNILLRAGYRVTVNTDLRPSCFDIVARRGESLLLLKVHENIDAFKEDAGRELKILS